MNEAPDLAGVEAAAKMITNARLAVGCIPDLGVHAPEDLATAHRIADAHAEQMGLDTVGWKIGCTSERARQILSCSESFPGRVFEGSVYGSHLLDFAAVDKPMLESEFAFIFGSPLPPRAEAYSIDEIRSATAAVAPAFEIVTSRFEDWLAVGYLSIIADSGSNGGVVLGEPVPVGDLPPLGEVGVTLTIDDEEISRGTGSDILGDPWQAVIWLVNDLSDRQIGLDAGQFVMSGTCTGAHPLPGGSKARATFEGLGTVDLERTPAP